MRICGTDLNDPFTPGITVVLFFTLVLLSCPGCASDLERRSAVKPPISSGPNPPSQGKTLALVVLGQQPTPFSFRVESKEVGPDMESLRQFIKQAGIKDIIFESDYKLTERRVAEMKDFFSSVGVYVHEFWVPISSRPGRVDLLKLK